MWLMITLILPTQLSYCENVAIMVIGLPVGIYGFNGHDVVHVLMVPVICIQFWLQITMEFKNP